MAAVKKGGEGSKPPPAYYAARAELLRYMMLMARAIEHDQWDDVITLAGKAIEPAVRLLMLKEE